MSLNDTSGKLRFLKAYPIKPSDDGFHGSKNIIDIEWWYFDAVFHNEYSVHVGFRIYHIRGFGILQQRITIYYKGATIRETRKVDVIKNKDFSKKSPTISIRNKDRVLFDDDHYRKTLNWRYRINLNIEDAEVDLLFEGTTPGWKIETDTTCWTVPLPKARVKGKMCFNGKKMDVTGIGYHDHNWGYSPVTVIQNQGWYWGRITAETLHLTWANTIASAYDQDLIAVINKEQEKENKPISHFHSVSPDKINFIPTEYGPSKRFQIPHTFQFSFKEQDTTTKTKISADIKMETVDVHYSRIFIIHYWRYHVKTNGTLSYGDITERLDDKSQIIEFLSFKEPRFACE